MDTPVSRREALALAAATATAALAHAAPVPKGKTDDGSWVGKTVLPKKPDPVAYYPAPPDSGDVTELACVLRGASWEVKAEKGTRVEVVEDGLASWVEKELVVTLGEATDFFTRALRENDQDAYAYNFRGWARYLLGKPTDAIKDFDSFLGLVPNEFPAHRVVGLSNRGLVLAETGKFDAAIKDLDEAVELGHTTARINRGWAYELKGEYRKAVDDYTTLLATRPTDTLALNNKAWLRATCPEAAHRDGKEAVKLAKQACEQTGNREGMYLDTLAAAHAEAGDFSAAVKAQERALEDKGYAKKYGSDAQKRLQLYKDKKPYRTAPAK